MPRSAPRSRWAPRGGAETEPAVADVDWLWNTITVSGPAGVVARFRAVARGTNAAPWHIDLEHEEARLWAPMASVGIEARLLARELRAVAEARQDRIRAHWAAPGGCPFDLHRLVPVPSRILALGADDPEARHWLITHWGTSRPLRRVHALDRLEDKRLRRSARFVVRFESADWTPWQAIQRLRTEWRLVFDVRPEYGGE